MKPAVTIELRRLPLRLVLFSTDAIAPMVAFRQLWHPRARGTDTYFATSAGIAATLLIADVVAIGLLAPTLLADGKDAIRLRGIPRFPIRVAHGYWRLNQSLMAWTAIAAGLIYPAVAMFTALDALTRCSSSASVVHCGRPADMAVSMGGILTAAAILLVQIVLGATARAHRTA